jgi:hypothetical protein
MIQQKSLAEVLSLAAFKAAKKGKREVGVIIKAPYLPPTEPFRTVRVQSVYGEVRITALPTPSGDWRVIVKFRGDGFRVEELVGKETSQSSSPNTTSQKP